MLKAMETKRARMSNVPRRVGGTMSEARSHDDATPGRRPTATRPSTAVAMLCVAADGSVAYTSSVDAFYSAYAEVDCGATAAWNGSSVAWDVSTRAVAASVFQVSGGGSPGATSGPSADELTVRPGALYYFP